MHLSEINTTNVINGQTIQAGVNVEKVGNTGNVSSNDPSNPYKGSHLHITIITNGSTNTSNYSNIIDPMVFFDEYDFTYSFS